MRKIRNTIPKANRRPLPGLNTCANGHIYTPRHGSRCPVCAELAQALGKPAPQAPAFIPTIGQPVATTQPVHITGAVIPAAAAGTVASGQNWQGAYLVAFSTGSYWLHPDQITPALPA